MNTTNETVQTLSDSETQKIMRDARIVAIRWDIMEWALVFDLDTPISEESGAEMRRAWVVFHGVSTLSIDVLEARMPTGINVISEMWVDPLPYKQDFQRATFQMLAMEGSSTEASTKEFVIVCKQVTGLASVGASSRDGIGLSWQARVSLASDEQMRDCLCAIQRN